MLRHNHNPFSHDHHQQQQHHQQQEQYNSIILCGPTRSKCGYCQGSRTDILSIPNPPSQFTVGTFVSSHNTGTIINSIDLGGTTDTSTGTSTSTSSNTISSTTNPNNEKITPSTSSKAYSILSSTISPNDYQKLLNKGWRRSGDLLYLPKNWECCCPSHPIRLDVNKFKLTKSLKKVMKNLKIALDSHSHRNSYSNSNSNINHAGDCEDSGNKSNGTSIAAGTFAVAVGSSNCSSNSSDYTIETDMSYEYNSTTTTTTTTTKQEEQNPTLQSKESLLLQGRKRPRKSNHDHTTSTTGHHHHHNLHNTKNTPKMKDAQPQSSQQQPQPQPPNIDQIHKHTKEYIHTKCHHILSWLQTITMQIAQDNVNSNANPNMDINNTNEEEEDNNNHQIYAIMKKCSNYKITKMSKPKHLHSSASVTWEYDMIITLSSTICTALHGISKGQIDKDQLGNVIVQELLLQRNTDCNSRNNSTSNITSDSNTITTSVIDSISFHPRSGHVNVTIKMNITMMTHNHNESTAPSKMDGNENNTKKEKKIENVISEFIQTYLESISTNTTTNDQSSQTQKVQPQPPFKLTVKSIPSCISGRDPKVHRLYTKYQAAIHHDPDPYSCSSNFNNNNHDDGKMKGVVIDHNDSIDNDEDDYDGQNIMDFDDMNTWMSSSSSHQGMKSEKLNMMDFRRIYKRRYDESQLKVIYKR